MTALAGGLLAGLGVAAPPGAIGILLLREGLAAGFRKAVPAAAAVALVDGAYCLLAVLASTAAAPLIASWGAVPAVTGGLALMVLGLTGALRDLRTGTGRRYVASSRGPGVAPPSRELPRFLLFLALTAINPLTLVYFSALAAGFHGVLSVSGGAAAFVTGAALGSAGWQLGLVFCGAFWRGRISPAGQRALTLAGHATVAVLGAAALAAAAA